MHASIELSLAGLPDFRLDRGRGLVHVRSHEQFAAGLQSAGGFVLPNFDIREFAVEGR